MVMLRGSGHSVSSQVHSLPFLRGQTSINTMMLAKEVLPIIYFGGMDRKIKFERITYSHLVIKVVFLKYLFISVISLNPNPWLAKVFIFWGKG